MTTSRTYVRGHQTGKSARMTSEGLWNSGKISRHQALAQYSQPMDSRLTQQYNTVPCVNMQSLAATYCCPFATLWRRR